MRHRHPFASRLLALAILVTSGAGSALAQTAAQTAPPAIAAGRAVAEVLRQLEKNGTRIVFSSELVPVSMRVAKETRAASVPELLTALLAPHGLTVRNGPRGVLLIVRSGRPADAATDDAAAEAAQTLERVPSIALPRIEEQLDVEGTAGEAERAPTVVRMVPRQVTETAGTLENPLRLLPMLPGVAAISEEQSSLAIRGSEPTHTRTLLDGVPIWTPFRVSPRPASVFDALTLASVSLDSSGLDAGFGGLSPTVSFDTRDGVATEAFTGSASIGAINSSVLVEGRLPGATSASWWLNARGTPYDLVAHEIDDRRNVQGFADIQGKVTLRPSPRTRLSLFGLGGYGTYRQGSLFPFDSELATRNQIAIATFAFKPGARLSIDTTASAYHDTSRLETPEIAFYSFERRMKLTDIGVRQRVRVDLKAHALEAGLDVHRLTTSLAMAGINIPTWYGMAEPAEPTLFGAHLPLTRPLDSRIAKTTTAVWLQDRITLGAATELRPALRVEHNTFTSETAALPRILISQRLGSAARLWAGVGWQTQTPGYETMLPGQLAFDLTAPGADLRNERSRQIVFGAERRFGASYALRVEAYHRSFDRLLVHAVETDDERAARLALFELPADLSPSSPVLEHRPTLRPLSTGTGTAYGAEVRLQREGRRLAGWLSYTWSRADRSAYGLTVPFDFDRRHALSLVNDLALTARMRLSTGVHLASGFPASAHVEDVLFSPVQREHGVVLAPTGGAGQPSLLTPFSWVGPKLATLNRDRQRPYLRIDARFTFAGPGRIDYFGEVTNLLNREPYTHAGTTPGGLSYDHEVYPGRGALLSVGARVRF